MTRAPVHGGVGLTRRAARGALLFDVMLALAVFMTAGLAIMSVVRRTAGELDSTRRVERAADLARSALARIEAGLATPQTLNGPVKEWDEDPEAMEGDPEAAKSGGGGFADSPPGRTGWELSIETEPSQFAGLTLVTATATDRGVGDAVRATYTLRQLVRLSEAKEDKAGAEDKLADEARRGLKGMKMGEWK